MNTSDEQYIRRCFDLARLGRKEASPNPMVGALIVHQQRIIGEGYHIAYGGPHAEVNAVSSVQAADRHLLKEATLYISLEPCCIHGRTPPCTELILANKIPRVVFSSLDQTPEVNGKSISILTEAGIDVSTGVLEKQGDKICRIRTTFAAQKRPYIILKYAQSADGFIGQEGKSIWLTNSTSKRLVHRWRSEVDSILVGRKTAEVDNPRLTTRYYRGSSPLRIVLDRQLQLSPQSHLFDGEVPTWVITAEDKYPLSTKNVTYRQLPFDDSLLPQLLAALAKEKKSTLLVEGGAKLLQSFIDQGLWDEARVFVSPKQLSEGIAAPSLPVVPKNHFQLDQDQLWQYFRI